MKGKEEKSISVGKEVQTERMSLPATNSHRIQVMSRKISPSLVNKTKNRHKMNQGWLSQEFNPSKTVQINKLKL